MTTIAYRDQVFVADSLATDTDGLKSECVKLYRFGSNRIGAPPGLDRVVTTVILGGAGSTDHIEIARRQIERAVEQGNCGAPEILLTWLFADKDLDCELLIGARETEGPNTRVRLFERVGRVFEEITGRTHGHAIGSGRKYALGAMMAGADAATAVQIASELDVHTNSRLQIENL